MRFASVIASLGLVVATDGLAAPGVTSVGPNPCPVPVDAANLNPADRVTPEIVFVTPGDQRRGRSADEVVIINVEAVLAERSKGHDLERQEDEADLADCPR